MTFFDKVLKTAQKENDKAALRQLKSPDVKGYADKDRFAENVLLGQVSNPNIKNTKRFTEAGAESTAIQRVQYEPNRKIAFVDFAGGGKTYAYPNVSTNTMNDWMRAGSKGRFFNRLVKKHSVKGFRAQPTTSTRVPVKIMDNIIVDN